MKKRILSILLTLCMVLTMMPATVFAADGEVAARASETGGLYEHHEACGANSAGASDTMMPKTRSGAVRPAATQYTYTLHYDANGGSGAPPSQSVKSTEFYVWVPISEKIPTRDGYTFMGWANTRTGKPIYGGNGGYTECLVVHGYDMSTTIYAIWEVHNHSWGEWTSNGNGTHTRTCNTDSSHTETGNCSGGKATGTEKAICETCHTAYGELLQPAKTVITTPPTLRLPAYVGNEYTDKALMGGEAKAEGTDTVVPGTFGFKYYEGGRVHPGENRMVILFTPKDTEAYTTAECILTVVGTKRTITRVPDDVIITDKPIGTAFEDLGLPLFPFGVKVETNTGASYSPVPVTWDGSTYDPNKYGEQIITGELHVERSGFTDDLEPTSTVKATARITLIDDRVFTPTLEPPTYSKQLYGGDLCFLVFADKYLSGGTATVNGETVSGKFTLDKDQKIYGHSLTASTLLQAGQLQLKIIFTPDNLKRYNKAKCTVDVNVVPRTFKETRAGHITNEKFGTPFEELNLSDSFSFYAVGDEKDPEGTGMDFGMNVVTSWDSSTYDPNSFEEQTIYGEVNRAELEKYFTIPDGTDLRAVRKVQLQPDPAETEITQLPVFRWKNGDFTLPDNTIFTWRKLQVGTYNGEVGTLVGGVAKVKGADTVAPGTFSFKNAPPFYLQTPGEHDVTVVFKPDDTRLHKPTETTIKINAIKNTIKDIDEPDPITDKSIGTPFAELGLPENVCINGVDGAWRWIEAAWNESSYDAQSSDWQTITGTLVLDEDANSIFQQPEPAVTASIQVKLTVPDSPPTVTTETLPGGTIDTPYSQRLFANGTEPIAWEVSDGKLPEGLNLNETTGVISGTPTAAGTATFIVKAKNHNGLDTKTLSITIAEAAEFIVTFDENGGTPSVGSMTTTNQKLSSLPSVSRSNYSFDGWFTDKDGGEKVTEATEFSKNTIVYAHWTYIGGSGGGGGSRKPSVTYYTLHFETNGGSAITDMREANNTHLSLTKYVPTRHGHTFIGWYSDQSLTNQISEVSLTKNMTVYAGWRADENLDIVVNPFTDVSEKDWFYNDAMFVYKNGLMLGTSKTLFSPHGTVTRGMMATILWRMEGSLAPKGENSFTDVEAGRWYADAITWATENGIFAGYSKDKFGPDDPITREQLTAIFYRYADYKGYKLTVTGNLDKFEDADKITDYAKTVMQWAVGNGLIKGKAETLLDPQGTATRAEIAAMLHRFVENTKPMQMD